MFPGGEEFEKRAELAVLDCADVLDRTTPQRTGIVVAPSCEASPAWPERRQRLLTGGAPWDFIDSFQINTHETSSGATVGSRKIASAPWCRRWGVVTRVHDPGDGPRVHITWDNGDKNVYPWMAPFGPGGSELPVFRVIHRSADVPLQLSRADGAPPAQGMLSLELRSFRNGIELAGPAAVGTPAASFRCIVEGEYFYANANSIKREALANDRPSAVQTPDDVDGLVWSFGLQGPVASRTSAPFCDANELLAPVAEFASDSAIEFLWHAGEVQDGATVADLSQLPPEELLVARARITLGEIVALQAEQLSAEGVAVVPEAELAIADPMGAARQAATSKRSELSGSRNMYPLGFFNQNYSGEGHRPVGPFSQTGSPPLLRRASFANPRFRGAAGAAAGSGDRPRSDNPDHAVRSRLDSGAQWDICCPDGIDADPYALGSNVTIGRQFERMNHGQLHGNYSGQVSDPDMDPTDGTLSSNEMASICDIRDADPELLRLWLPIEVLDQKRGPRWAQWETERTPRSLEGRPVMNARRSLPISSDGPYLLVHLRYLPASGMRLRTGPLAYTAAHWAVLRSLLPQYLTRTVVIPQRAPSLLMTGMLMAWGIDWSARSLDGLTVLDLACFTTSSGLVYNILDASQNKALTSCVAHAKKDVHASIRSAAQHDDESAAEDAPRLLGRAARNPTSRNSLHFAVLAGAPQVASVIQARRPELAVQQDGAGATPLLLACSLGLNFVAITLLDGRVNLDKIHDAAARPVRNFGRRWPLRHHHGLLPAWRTRPRAEIPLRQLTRRVDDSDDDELLPLAEGRRAPRARGIVIRAERDTGETKEPTPEQEEKGTVDETEPGGAATGRDATSEEEEASSADEDDGAGERESAAPSASALGLRCPEVNISDVMGRTPLMYAARSGSAVVCAGLALRGADVNARDADGATALIWAVRSRRLEVVRLLLWQHGARADVCDKLNRTALHWAALAGDPAIVNALCAGGPASPRSPGLVTPAVVMAPEEATDATAGERNPATEMVPFVSPGREGYNAWHQCRNYRYGNNAVGWYRDPSAATVVPEFEPPNPESRDASGLTPVELALTAVAEVRSKKQRVAAEGDTRAAAASGRSSRSDVARGLRDLIEQRERLDVRVHAYEDTIGALRPAVARHAALRRGVAAAVAAMAASASTGSSAPGASTAGTVASGGDGGAEETKEPRGGAFEEDSSDFAPDDAEYCYVSEGEDGLATATARIVRQDSRGSEDPSVASPPPPTAVSNMPEAPPLMVQQASHQVFNSVQVARERVSLLVATAKAVKLQLAATGRLLASYAWDLDAAVADYGDDPERALARAGLPPSAAAAPEPGSAVTVKEDASSSGQAKGDHSSEAECPVCMSPPAEGGGLCTLRCHHSACRDCWIDHLRASLATGGPAVVSDTPCVTPDCARRLDEADWAALSAKHAPEVLANFQRFVVRSFIELAPDMMWCRNPDGCDRVLQYSGTRTSLRCECGFLVCSRCGDAAHDPVGCSELKAWNLLNESGRDDASLALILKRYKRCPKCKNAIEKNAGCDHVSVATAQALKGSSRRSTANALLIVGVSR